MPWWVEVNIDAYVDYFDPTCVHPTCHLLFALFKTTTTTISYTIYLATVRTSVAQMTTTQCRPVIRNLSSSRMLPSWFVTQMTVHHFDADCPTTTVRFFCSKTACVASVKNYYSPLSSVCRVAQKVRPQKVRPMFLIACIIIMPTSICVIFKRLTLL